MFKLTKAEGGRRKAEGGRRKSSEREYGTNVSSSTSVFGLHRSSVFGQINYKLNYIMMKRLFFSLLVTAISQIAFAQNQVPKPNWQFKNG